MKRTLWVVEQKIDIVIARDLSQSLLHAEAHEITLIFGSISAKIRKKIKEEGKEERLK